MSSLTVLLGRALLRFGLAADDREFMAGDLEEELSQRLADGRRRRGAGRWFLWQSARAVVGRRLGGRRRQRGTGARGSRDRPGDRLLVTVLQDLVFSARVLRKQRGFTAGALITLALGIGATTTMFTFVNGLLLRPMPYPEAEQLVSLAHVDRVGRPSRANYLSYLDWVDRSTSFTVTAAYYDNSFNLSTEAEPVRVPGILTTGRLFEVLGVPARLGRTLRSEDDVPGADRVVVISDLLWASSFAADPAVVGTEIRLHGRPYVVVGVMPPGFDFESADLWVAARIDAATMDRGSYYWRAIGRLREDATVAGARAELAAIGTAIATEHPDEAGGSGATVVPLRETLVGDSATPALLFLGAVVFVQMIATVNVGNLLLARASGRRKEVAIRAALGASRGRIVRWLMTESFLLAGFGGAFGIVLGVIGRNLVLNAIPVPPPASFDFSFDYRVGAFVAVLSGLTGVVFGLVPALYASRNLSEAIKHEGGGTGSAPRQRLRGALVIAEVALALILLVGAGLLLKGLAAVRQVDPGIEPTGVLTMRLSLPVAQYEETERRRVFYEQVHERLIGVSGIEAVATIAWLPLANSGSNSIVTPEGFEPGPDERSPSLLYNVASEDYFDVMGIPLLGGRGFKATDADPEIGPVAVIDRQAAEQFWPDGNPVGKRLRFGYAEDAGPWVTVVGVVASVRHWNLGNPAPATVYLAAGRQAPSSTFMVAATRGDPLLVVEAVRAAVREVDPDLPLYSIRTMERVMEESTWQPVVFSSMFSIFASLALVLAAAGLYGVISFSVGRRAHEIGIRRALGAVPGDVLRLVVREAMRLVGGGMVIGIIGAAGLMGLMSSLLHGVNARDPLVYATVTAVLGLVGLVAAWIPARRATRVDPVRVLRTE